MTSALNHDSDFKETDPLDFDSKCDGSLPLEQMIFPNPVTRKLLQDIDRSKVRVWALTNAYVTVCLSVSFGSVPIFFPTSNRDSTHVECSGYLTSKTK